jgi:hypothetical protein
MKCVLQSCPELNLDGLLNECLAMTYNAVHYGEENGIENRKGMKVFYRTLKDTKLPSCYKVAAITRACVAIQSRKKSEKRRIEVRHPRPLKPMVCIISGFVSMKGRLFIPLRRDKYVDVQLNHHVLEAFSGQPAEDKETQALEVSAFSHFSSTERARDAIAFSSLSSGIHISFPCSASPLGTMVSLSKLRIVP